VVEMFIVRRLRINTAERKRAAPHFCGCVTQRKKFARFASAGKAVGNAFGFKNSSDNKVCLGLARNLPRRENANAVVQSVGAETPERKEAKNCVVLYLARMII
jgi:hypothetical protein